jgi:alpha-tubulin suppressor-like RCC1 family protein
MNVSCIKLKTLSFFSTKRLLNKSYKAVTVCLVFSMSMILAGCGNDSGGSYSNKTKTVISATGFSSFILTNEGRVYAAGDNEYGQLGLGDNNGYKTFTEVAYLNNKSITAISGDNRHSLALSSEGRVYATGDNQYGQLGLGDNVNRNVFMEVTLP